LIGLTNNTWYGILEMAEEFGWNPMGTIFPGWEAGGMPFSGFGLPDAQYWGIHELRPPEMRGEYWGDNGDSRTVLFEDALNLADALERATLYYEPQYIPSLYYYTMFGEHNGSNGTQPSLGAIQGVIDLCYLGAFQIENF
jgi:hypothetical protein